MENEITLVCAWCRRIKDKDGHPLSSSYTLKRLKGGRMVISHGICLKCSAKLEDSFNGKEAD